MSAPVFPQAPDLRAAASLANRWRAEATLLRQRGAAQQADLLDGCATELVAVVEQAELEALSIAAAAAESGLSPSQLRRLVKTGALPNVQGDGPMRVRRGDLPRKLRPNRGDGPHLARAVLALAEAPY